MLLLCANQCKMYLYCFLRTIITMYTCYYGSSYVVLLYYFNINVHYTNIVIYIYKSFPIKVNTKPFVIVNTR